MKTTKSEQKPTVWTLVTCPNGAQWSWAHPVFAERICTFSGCDCGQPLKIVKKTEDGDEAAAWFKRP